MRRAAIALLLTLAPLAAVGQAEKITGYLLRLEEHHAYSVTYYQDNSSLTVYEAPLLILTSDESVIVAACRLDGPWPAKDSSAASHAVHVGRRAGNPIECWQAENGAYTFAGWWRDGVFYVLGMEADRTVKSER